MLNFKMHVVQRVPGGMASKDNKETEIAHCTEAEERKLLQRATQRNAAQNCSVRNERGGVSSRYACTTNFENLFCSCLFFLHWKYIH